LKKPFAKKEPVQLKKGYTRLKPHSTYKNKNGLILPSVTTIIGQLGKPYLITWANKMGLKGIDSNKYRDEMGVIGSLAHALISSDIKGEKLEVSDFTIEQLEKAGNCVKSYNKWKGDRLFAPFAVETPLVSEEYQFGGTPDYFGLVDAIETILDYKTGAVYKEAYIQICAYNQLLKENGYEVPKRSIILGIPRTDDEKFQEVFYDNFEAGWECFKHLLAVYNYLKDLK
jgi:hypothetical protein